MYADMNAPKREDKMTKEVFAEFLKSYIVEYNIDLKKEPPQVSFFNFVENEDTSAFVLSYPHLTLDNINIEMWSTEIRIAMESEEYDHCDGFVFWCIAEDEKGKDNLMFFIYEKTTDFIQSYTSNLFLSSFKEVLLGDTIPFLIDNYGEALVYH